MLRGLVVDYGGVLTDFGDQPGAGYPRAGDAPLVGVLRQARRGGLRTALLSNADGGGPRPAGWADLFDAVVLSGEVGLAKPDERIYHLVARRLGLVPAECVFVDDLPGNVRCAVAAGMVGVHHTSVASTLDELAALFDLPLTG